MRRLALVAFAALIILANEYICISIAEEREFKLQELEDSSIRILNEQEIPVMRIHDVAINDQYIAVMYCPRSSVFIYAVYDVSGRFIYAYQIIYGGTRRFVDATGSVIIYQGRTRPPIVYRLEKPVSEMPKIYSFHPNQAYLENLLSDVRSCSYTVNSKWQDKLIIEDANGGKTVVFDHSVEFIRKFGYYGDFSSEYIRIIAGLVLSIIVFIIVAQHQKGRLNTLHEYQSSKTKEQGKR